MKHNRSAPRFFGYLELTFNLSYLFIGLSIGISLLSRSAEGIHRLTGGIAMLLMIGDMFHLIPRILVIITGGTATMQTALGTGKLVTSVTMTIFYILLWQAALSQFPAVPYVWSVLVYLLAALRIALCLFPQNAWHARNPSFRWGLYRNIPFVLLGLLVAILFGIYHNTVPEWNWMWLAIALSFAFYIPVVLGAGKYPKLGMLMLPKTCMYLWILFMFTAL